MLFSLFHRQKMEVLGCVGLVTHSKSSAVLLNDCLRRIKMLSPLDDAEAQQNVEELPIKPSGDQLAKALAPGNNILPCVEQQCIYSNSYFIINEEIQKYLKHITHHGKITQL